MRMTGVTDFDIATLRARRTNKWHKFPPDVLPAWVADMDFGVAPSITAALARLTRDQEYGYAARDGVLAAAFVRRMERRFGWHTDPADTVAIGLQLAADAVILVGSAEGSRRRVKGGCGPRRRQDAGCVVRISP